MDRWILAKAEEMVRNCRVWYDELAFHKVYRAVYDFATTDLSAVYFDVLKDRLYTSATRSRARRSGQTAVYRIHYALTRLLAPLLAFTAEEVWGFTSRPVGAPDSVHMALLPEPEELATGFDVTRLAKWDGLMEVRTEVLKELEGKRQAKFIGSPLEARVRLQGYALEDYAGRFARTVYRIASGSRAWRRAPSDRGTSRWRQVRTLLEVLDRPWARIRITRRFAIPARRRFGKCWDERTDAIDRHHCRGGVARSCDQNLYPYTRVRLGIPSR